MNANIAGFGNIRQLGYVVKDLDTSVKGWMSTTGTGPWTIIKNIPLQSLYLGKESKPVIDIALAYQGDLQIELICQKNEAPSPYRKFTDAGRFGLHHTAYLSEDIEADMAKACERNLDIVCDINMPDGGRYVYTQNPLLGEDVYVEFLEATPTMKKMFVDGIKAATEWNGKDKPVVIDYAAFS